MTAVTIHAQCCPKTKHPAYLSPANHSSYAPPAERGDSSSSPYPYPYPYPGPPSSPSPSPSPRKNSSSGEGPDLLPVCLPPVEIFLGGGLPDVLLRRTLIAGLAMAADAAAAAATEVATTPADPGLPGGRQGAALLRSSVVCCVGMGRGW